MPAPSPVRRTPRRRLSRLVAALAPSLALVVSGTLLSPPAQAAANPVTPGNYTGLGFDQCEAPSASAMRTWIRKSPFRAAGIYISGASRACQRQTNLTPTWVRDRLAEGWHLMPITLGPQAWCTDRDRYLKQVRINPSTTNNYGKARAQGALEARRAVAVARDLGIVPRSTLFYDLEAWNIYRSSACTNSALWFLSSWTRQLHNLGYASGVYSSAASGIKVLDDARVRPGNRATMPDQVWIADWNGRADTNSSYIRSDGWQPHGRAHQFQGGHNETWGGVTINIDRNYLDLRTPDLGTKAPAPAPAPAPGAPEPAFTGASTADAKCTSASISKRAYRKVSAEVGRHLVVPLQCLLKQQHHYQYEVTGTWNAQTIAALNDFQEQHGFPLRRYVTRNHWVAMITVGSARTALRPVARGADVVRVQRALNAAGNPRLKVSGVYGRGTRLAVAGYQRSVGIKPSGIVGRLTWKALLEGRR